MQKTTAICPNCGDSFEYYPSAYKGKSKTFCSRKCWSNSTWLTKNCLFCGKEFKCRRCEPSECCTKTCARRHANRDKHITFKCDQCGVELTRRMSSYRPDADNHFCSMECWGLWLKDRENLKRRKRVERTCKQCGKVFEITPSQLLFKGNGSFCNRSCQGRFYVKQRLVPKLIQCGEKNINWKGGNQKYYGPSWKAQRRAARKRDCYTCQRCGMTEIDLCKELDVHHIRPFREFGLTRHTEANDLSNLVSLCDYCHKIVEPRGCVPGAPTKNGEP